MVNSIPVSSNPKTVLLKPTATPQFGNASKLKASAKVDAFQPKRNVQFGNNNNSEPSRVGTGLWKALKYGSLTALVQSPIAVPLALVQFVLAPFTAGITAITGFKTLVLLPAIMSMVGFVKGFAFPGKK